MRVVYLVRDPRGTMSSRYRANWCMKSSDCGSYVSLCADLIDDYAAALRLKRDYPSRFKYLNPTIFILFDYLFKLFKNC